MTTQVSPAKWIQNTSTLVSNTVSQGFAFFSFPNASGTIETAKLLWLTRLRWLAIFIFTILAVPGYELGYLTRDSVTTYLGLVSILFVFNLISHLTVSVSREATSPLWLCLHLSFDLLALTSLLALTGGPESPLMPIFLLNVVLGGLLISKNLSWSFLALAHGLLALLQVQNLFRYQSSLDQKLIGSYLAAHILLEIFFIVTRSLGAYIEKQYSLQSQARLALERHDRLRAVGALAAGFSHEFSSPLTTAKIRLERMSRTAPSEDTTEALLAVEACETVVKQMNSSQLDNRDHLYKSIIVSDLIADVVDSWSEIHPHVQITRQFLDRSQQRVPPLNLAQVVLNLLDNAYEANPNTPIVVTTERLGDEFALSVVDQGPGFDLATLARLGEPFNTSKPQGTGLGLYISKLFSESLGGKLLIEPSQEPNESPRGSRVSLFWPLKDVHDVTR